MVGKNNDYVIQVKHGRRALKREILQLVGQAPAKESISLTEVNRGRLETREVSVYEPGPVLTGGWPRLAKVVTVRRMTVRGGRAQEGIHYYITSLSNTPPEELLSIIRSHWGIENRLHWVKDAIMKEDLTRFHDYKTFKKNSLYRNVVVNIFRLNKFDSVKQALEKFANKPEAVYKLLRI